MRRHVSVSQYLGDLLLGTDRAMRLRLGQTGLALLLMLMGMAVVLWAAWALDRPRGPLYVWTLSSLFAIVVVYLTIRCGWSQRFKDPSLTLPQMAIAIACSATGYALMGPVRAIAFPNLLIIRVVSATLQTPRHPTHAAPARGRSSSWRMLRRARRAARPCRCATQSGGASASLAAAASARASASV